MKTVIHVEKNVSCLRMSRKTRQKRFHTRRKKNVGTLFVGGFLTLVSIVQPAFGDTVVPEWNNPVAPHHGGSVWEGTGSQQSGLIDLGEGRTYGNSSHIYDGSQLKYYFNDYTAYYSEQEAQLASNVVEAVANEAVAAAALAAASAAAVADPSGPAVAAATLAVATADLVIASWALDYFKRWEYEHVAAIDYNSSITVNGYGTLLGTYQNVETLKLTQSGGVIQLGNSSHSGVFRNVDYLDAAGSLILNDSAVLDTLGMVNIQNSLSNGGMIYKVENLNVTDDIQNSGLMNQVNLLTGSNFTNDVDASATFGKVTLMGNLSNAGFFSVDDSLEAKTVTTTGTLHVGGDVKTTQTSGTTFKNTNTAIIGGSLTTYGLENSGVLKVQNTIDATEVKNLTDATLVTDTFQVSTFQNKGNAIATNMTATTLNNETTGGLIVTNFLEATDITNSGSLTAEYIQAKNLTNTGNSAKFWTMNLSAETVANSGVITVDGVTNVTDSLTNTGTMAIDGATNVTNSLTNSGSLTTHGVVTVNDAIQNNDGGVWTTYGAVTGKTLTNDASGTIQLGENMKMTATLDNSGTIQGVFGAETLMAGTLTNTGENAIIENLERITVAGDLENTGTLKEIERIKVGGNFSTSGESVTNNVTGIERLEVSGTSHLVDGATIQGTSDIASSFTTNGLAGENDGDAFNGQITGFTTVKNTETFHIGKEGKILGTGENSTFTQTGDTVNDGTVGNFQNATFDGKLENNNTIAEVDRLAVLSDATNGENAQISGTGVNSEMHVSGNFDNSGLVTGFGFAQIDGELANDGDINGTDICALLSAQSVNNTGMIQRIETIHVAQSMTNTGEISTFRNINVGTETEDGGTGTFLNDGGTLNLTIKDDIISKINVNGTATVSGGTVNVSGDRMAVGESYVFLTTSDGLTVDEEFIITIDGRVNPKLFHAEGFYNENDYWITSKRNHTYEDLPGATYNQQNTGKYLDQLSYALDTSNPDYDKTDLYHVLVALDGVADEAEVMGDDTNVRKALDEMSGSIYANMGLMTLQNTWYVHQNIANMIRPLDCQYCETDNPNSRERNLWGSFLGNTGEIDSDGNSHGFDYESYGLIVGSDLMRNDYFRVGAHFQYMDTNMSQNGIVSSADMNNYDLGLYGIFQYNLGYILASADFGYTSYDVTRSFAFGGGEDFISRTHSGETDSAQQSVRLESAWDLTMDNRMALLRPFLAVTYTHVQMDGVSETSDIPDTYITELVNHDYDLDSLRSEVGIRATRCFQTDSFTFGINGRATWVHEFCDTYTTLTNNFNNQNEFQNTGSYLVRGVDLGRDYAWLGLGITADTSTAWTFFGGYDALVNNQTLIHNFNLGVSLNW